MEFQKVLVNFGDKSYSLNKNKSGYYTMYDGETINFASLIDAEKWLNSVDNCVWLNDSESFESVYEYNIDSWGCVTITSNNRKIAFLQNDDASELIQEIENAENAVFKDGYNPLNVLLGFYDC